jgi:hypothetical protein
MHRQQAEERRRANLFYGMILPKIRYPESCMLARQKESHYKGNGNPAK